LEREKRSAERFRSPEGEALWQVVVSVVRQIPTCKEEPPSHNTHFLQTALAHRERFCQKKEQKDDMIFLGIFNYWINRICLHIFSENL
jgi:hypothetical protein